MKTIRYLVLLVVLCCAGASEKSIPERYSDEDSSVGINWVQTGNIYKYKDNTFYFVQTYSRHRRMQIKRDARGSLIDVRFDTIWYTHHTLSDTLPDPTTHVFRPGDYSTVTLQHYINSFVVKSKANIRGNVDHFYIHEPVIPTRTYYNYYIHQDEDLWSYE